MDIPEKTGRPDFENKMNRMSKNRLTDVKSIECSNTVIRFQCSYKSEMSLMPQRNGKCEQHFESTHDTYILNISN